MSELKAYKMVDEEYCTDCLCVIPSDVYLKSEADKVIAHSNHKRCLAMAKVCYLRFVRYENYLQKLCASNATIAAYVFRRNMYDKWEKRWRELAEEPTWAKFLQLIHKED